MSVLKDLSSRCFHTETRCSGNQTDSKIYSWIRHKKGNSLNCIEKPKTLYIELKPKAGFTANLLCVRLFVQRMSDAIKFFELESVYSSKSENTYFHRYFIAFFWYLIWQQLLYLVTDIFPYFIQLKTIALLSHLAFKVCSILYTWHVLLGFSLSILTPFSHVDASMSVGGFDQNPRESGIRESWVERD